VMLFPASAICAYGFRTLAPAPLRRFQDRKLAFIDAHRAIFTGMVHPDHGFDIDRRAGCSWFWAYVP